MLTCDPCIRSLRCLLLRWCSERSLRIPLKYSYLVYLEPIGTKYDQGSDLFRGRALLRRGLKCFLYSCYRRYHSDELHVFVSCCILYQVPYVIIVYVDFWHILKPSFSLCSSRFVKLSDWHDAFGRDLSLMLSSGCLQYSLLCGHAEG